MFTEKYMNIYNSKSIWCESLLDNESNCIDLSLYMLIFLSINFVKVYKVWFWPKLIRGVNKKEGVHCINKYIVWGITSWLARQMPVATRTAQLFTLGAALTRQLEVGAPPSVATWKGLVRTYLVSTHWAAIFGP